MSEVVRTVRVPNPAGLHARPCQAIAQVVQRHQASLRVACDGQEVDARSILELMTLCAPCESWISFRARGADSDVLVARLAALVEAGFHESD